MLLISLPLPFIKNFRIKQKINNYIKQIVYKKLSCSISRIIKKKKKKVCNHLNFKQFFKCNHHQCKKQRNIREKRCYLQKNNSLPQLLQILQSETNQDKNLKINNFDVLVMFKHVRFVSYMIVAYTIQ